MKFLIITGMSGAGKSSTIRCLEDMGYYCIDNMPPVLIPKFAELCSKFSNELSRAAVVCDIRGGELFNEFYSSVQKLKEDNIELEILFLDASDEVLIKRYKETRRKHPLGYTGRISEAIKKERAMLKAAKDLANYVIDTSVVSAKQLVKEITQIFNENNSNKGMVVNVLSFGFKYGLPIDADLVFDVRFLPNPYYIDELKEHSGLDECVSSYVMSFDASLQFREKLFDMMDFLIPKFYDEGKSQLVIAIGCTGGRHRSVAFAVAVAEHIKNMGFATTVFHRDYKKDLLKN